MYVGRDFDPSDVGESEVYTFDFVKDLASGETISAAAWECAVIEGDDGSASARLIGLPSNDGKKTSHRVAGLVADVKYRLRATVTSSGGNLVSLWSHVQCRTPA